MFEFLAFNNFYGPQNNIEKSIPNPMKCLGFESPPNCVLINCEYSRLAAENKSLSWIFQAYDVNIMWLESFAVYSLSLFFFQALS